MNVTWYSINEFGAWITSPDGDIAFRSEVEPILNAHQQLKAKIASLCDEMESVCYPGRYGMHIETFLSKLRQLSAV